MVFSTHHEAERQRQQGASRTFFKTHTDTHGTSMFEYLERDAEHRSYFDDWMSGRRAGLRHEWFDLYPIESRLNAESNQGNDAVFLVDITGGQASRYLKL